MTTGRALIGHTGFVGGNLMRQTTFDGCYNSRSIDEIAGHSFDLLVCAGAPAEKWRANREPEVDRQNIARLVRALASVTAARTILISTVDVYPDPVAVDESSPIDAERCHAYGRHRLELEQFFRERFDALVVRLPGLFGRGLKKNVIYDFLHDNQISQIHADAQFQFYPLDLLWRDIETASGAGLQLLNVATEPMTVANVAMDVLGIEFDNRPPGTPARYDVRSRHAALFGGRGGYLYERQTVSRALRQFAVAERSAA